VSYIKKKNYFFVTPDGIKDAKYFADLYQAKSVLDYGCGETRLDIHALTRYDPFFNGCNKFPTQKSDLVFCHNVLNNINSTELQPIIGHIFSLTKRAAVINIQFPGVYKIRNSEYRQYMIQAGFTVKHNTKIELKEFEKTVGIPVSDTNPEWDLKNMVYHFLLEKN
jgi:hypothetical protein